MTEAEERAHGSAEQNDVIAVVDGFGEGVLVGVEDGEDAGEEGVRRGGFEVAVEFEEFGEEREDEGEGDLDGVVNGYISQQCLVRVTYEIEEEGYHEYSEDLFPLRRRDWRCCCHVESV